MKIRTILQGAAVVLLLASLSACDWLFAERLTDAQRAAAFVETANDPDRTALEMRAHFHPDVPTYRTLMNTRGFWDNTFFKSDGQPFALEGMVPGGELELVPLTTSLSGTITSANLTSTPITFGFLPDPEQPANRLIAVILVPGVDDPIRTIK